MNVMKWLGLCVPTFCQYFLSALVLAMLPRKWKQDLWLI